MEPITAAFGLACIAAGGGAGFWLKKVDERLTGVNETAVVLQQAQAAQGRTEQADARLDRQVPEWRSRRAR